MRPILKSLEVCVVDEVEVMRWLELSEVIGCVDEVDLMEMRR